MDAISTAAWNSNPSSRSTSSAERAAGRALRSALCAFACGYAISASGFAAVVSPARFELKAKPGQVSRQVLDIGNDSNAIDEFAVSTADWRLSPDGGASFQEELQPQSCRPWVRLERRTVKLQPNARRKFRFEIHVPPDAPARECRFAIIIEKAQPEDTRIELGNIQFPVQGRIGVIVYVGVGDVAPKLSLVGLEMRQVRGRLLPVVTLRNEGNAHGRAEGVLQGTDASGKTYEFTVANSPILPGEVRAIALQPHETRESPVSIQPPLRLRGAIEWEKGRQPVNELLRP